MKTFLNFLLLVLLILNSIGTIIGFRVKICTKFSLVISSVYVEIDQEISSDTVLGQFTDGAQKYDITIPNHKKFDGKLGEMKFIVKQIPSINQQYEAKQILYTLKIKRD